MKNLELYVSYLTPFILAFEGLDEPAAGTQVARQDDFLKLSGRELLMHAGTVSHEKATARPDRI